MNATVDHNPSGATTCPECGQAGQPVQGQTVKALLAVTLRAVLGVEYRFCRTRTCPVVYYLPDGWSTFTVGDVRERMFQKEPEAADVAICYCFGHTIGDLRLGSAEVRAAILEDINTGIDAGQCACDLRNPQGSCCLGNVRRLVRQFDRRDSISIAPPACPTRRRLPPAARHSPRS